MTKHRSMRGEPIDLNKLAAQSEKSITVGNTSTNARGDQLGKGGKIIRSAESIARDHYNTSNPKAVKVAGLKEDLRQEEKQEVDDWDEPSAPVEQPKESPKQQSKIVKNAPKADAPKQDDQWVEDSEGNFVKKEDAK